MNLEQRDVTLAVRGMTCASCVARVEKRLASVPGVSAAVNLATESAKVRVIGSASDDDLVAAVASAGYNATVSRGSSRTPDSAAGASHPAEESPPADVPHDHEHEHEHNHGGGGLRLRLIISAVLSVPIVAVSMSMPLHFPGWQWWALALSLPVVVWGGWPFHRATMASARHGAATMDTLISLGTIAALGWSIWETMAGSDHVYYEVAVVVTVFLLLGRVIEGRSRRRAGESLRALMSLEATDVVLATSDGRDGATVPIDQLRVGERFVVRPGQKVASDGIVTAGSAAVDVSMITGESVPVAVESADSVTGGSICVDGRLIVEATAVGADTRLAHIARLVEDAQAGKSRVQRLADRISGVFVPIVIALAVVTLVLWLVVGRPADEAVTAAVAVIIIACPCALGLATPVAILVGTSRGAEMGILITGPEAIEAAGSIDTVVLDKTGTVTTGAMTVRRVVAAGASEHDVLRIAAALEVGSEHPVARAIVSAAPEGVHAAGTFRSVAGGGVSGTIDGVPAIAGTVAFLLDRGALVPDGLRNVATEATTPVFVAWASAAGMTPQARGLILVADTVRPDSATAIAELEQLGVSPVLVTGDRDEVAAAVAAEVGIRDVVAQSSPERKVAEVQRYRAAGNRVAMVGDGVNDAAALASADLGIAMGRGTDAAMHASDVTLMRPSLLAAVDAIRLARATMSTIRGNLIWAFAYNVAAIPLAAFGLLNPMIAAAAMAFSSIFVVINSLRLRRFRSVPEKPTREAAP